MLAPRALPWAALGGPSVGTTPCFSCPLRTCAGAVVLMCSQLQFSTRAPPGRVRVAPMAPDKQAVPMKGARHAALSAKTTIKKQAPCTVLRSIAAQAAGRTPGKQAGKAPRVTWIVVHAHLWLSLGIRGVRMFLRGLASYGQLSMGCFTSLRASRGRRFQCSAAKARCSILRWVSLGWPCPR